MQSSAATAKPSSNGEQAILKAAEVLFAEKGFDAVSMSAISRLANTSKPNIYHHFKSKDQLYIAVMQGAVQRSSDLLDELEHAPGSVGQHLSGFSSGQLDNILKHNLSTQLILREALSGGSRHEQDFAQHVVGGVFTRLVSMVKSGQQEGEFRDDIDPAVAAFMIVASNMFFFQAIPVMQHIPEAGFTNDADKFSKGVMEILFNGVRRKEKPES